MICYFSRTSAIINSISGALGTLCYGEAPVMIIINNKIQLQNVFIDNTRLFPPRGDITNKMLHTREKHQSGDRSGLVLKTHTVDKPHTGPNRCQTALRMRSIWLILCPRSAINHHRRKPITSRENLSSTLARKQKAPIS